MQLGQLVLGADDRAGIYLGTDPDGTILIAWLANVEKAEPGTFDGNPETFANAVASQTQPQPSVLAGNSSATTVTPGSILKTPDGNSATVGTIAIACPDGGTVTEPDGTVVNVPAGSSVVASS